MKKVTCVWEEDFGVSLSIADDMFVLYEGVNIDKSPPHGPHVHGYVTKGSMFLTIEESETLGMELMLAAAEACGLERTAIEMNL